MAKKKGKREEFKVATKEFVTMVEAAFRASEGVQVRAWFKGSHVEFYKFKRVNERGVVVYHATPCLLYQLAGTLSEFKKLENKAVMIIRGHLIKMVIEDFIVQQEFANIVVVDDDIFIGGRYHWAACFVSMTDYIVYE